MVSRLTLRLVASPSPKQLYSTCVDRTSIKAPISTVVSVLPLSVLGSIRRPAHLPNLPLPSLTSPSLGRNAALDWRLTTPLLRLPMATCPDRGRPWATLTKEVLTHTNFPLPSIPIWRRFLVPSSSMTHMARLAWTTHRPSDNLLHSVWVVKT